MVDTRPEMQLHMQLSNSTTTSSDMHGANSQANCYLAIARRNILKWERRMKIQQRQAEAARRKAALQESTTTSEDTHDETEKAEHGTKRQYYPSPAGFPTTPEVDESVGKLVSPPLALMSATATMSDMQTTKKPKVDIMAQVIKVEKKGWANITDIAGRLNVLDNITRESYALYKRLVTLFKINSGLHGATNTTTLDSDLLKKMSVRFLCEPSTAMAAIYAVCKHSMQPRSLKDICFACPEVKKKELGKKIILLQKMLAGDDKVHAQNNHLVASYVEQQCAKFGIGDDVAMFARELVECLHDQKYLEGSPVSLAATVLFVSMAVASHALVRDSGTSATTPFGIGKRKSFKLEMGSPTAATDMCTSLSEIVSFSDRHVETLKDVCKKCSIDRTTVENALNRIRPALVTMYVA
jgi:hypothetical protein